MTKLDIRRIIIKYLHQEATIEEISMLYEWVKKEGNQEVFKKLVQADFLINYQNKSWDSEEAFTQFLKDIRDKEYFESIPLYANKNIWNYAAAILVLITSTTYFILNRDSKVTTQPIFDSNQITLQLDNGEIISLDYGNDTILKSKNGSTNIRVDNGVLYQDDKKKYF